jgi:mono/diheme cytochrome c family protein
MGSAWSVERSRRRPGRNPFAARIGSAGVPTLAGAGAGRGLVLAAVVSLVGLAPVAAQPAEDHRGKAPYQRWCAGCHGVDGDGRGPAAEWMLPRPRDFTRADYRIRTTEPEALPSDADILRMIDEGMPGTAMPGWRGRLSRREREALVDYLKAFSPFFEGEPAPPTLAPGRPPRSTAEALEEGRRIYDLAEMSSGEQAVFPLVYEFVRLDIRRSVVLVDELELHLHPPEQQRLLAALPRIGPDCQFLMTTHSEFLSSAIPNEREVRLEGGTRCL